MADTSCHIQADDLSLIAMTSDIVSITTPLLYLSYLTLTYTFIFVKWSFCFNCLKLKVKVKIYSLISSLKTYHPTSHFNHWSLDLFIRVPSQLHGEHTVLQPFRRIELFIHIAISVLPGTHFHLSQVRVKCLAQGNNIEPMSQYWEGRNMIFFWKPCTKRDSKPHGRQWNRQSSAL